MYGTPAHLVIGFHACDQSVGEAVLAGKTGLKVSTNKYDWLGSGRYFWEGNYDRALAYGRWLAKRKTNPKIGKVFVMGAIIDLGLCLNLLEDENLKILQNAYERLANVLLKTGSPMPENKPLKGSEDLLMRNLDCAVVETVHQLTMSENLPAYDSVRGVFWEGSELYPNAGFRQHNHIQICVRNPNCIKGYFRPLTHSPEHPLPSLVRAL